MASEVITKQNYIYHIHTIDKICQSVFRLCIYGRHSCFKSAHCPFMFVHKLEKKIDWTSKWQYFLNSIFTAWNRILRTGRKCNQENPKERPHYSGWLQRKDRRCLRELGRHCRSVRNRRDRQGTSLAGVCEQPSAHHYQHPLPAQDLTKDNLARTKRDGSQPNWLHSDPMAFQVKHQ